MFAIIFTSALIATFAIVIPALRSKKAIEETELLDEFPDVEYWDKIKIVPKEKEPEPKILTTIPF